MNKNILIISHDWGGGTEIFMRNYISTLKEYNVYILRVENINNNLAYIFTDFQTGKKSGYVYSPLLSEDDLIAKTIELNIDEIFINHFITFDIPIMIKFIININIPFTFFMHDYFCICHNYKLTCGQKYCRDLNSPECTGPFSKGTNINNYQYWWHVLLKKAKKVIAPSKCAAEIFKKNYPDIPIQVEPHKVLLPLTYTFDENKVTKNKKLNIVFPGIISKEKGLEYLIKMKMYIDMNNLPINLIVLGQIYPYSMEGTLDNVKITGEYEPSEISELLRKLEASIVAVLSTWEETYCYTASEAILSGYPVLSFDVGAHAERIEKHNCGWILPLGYDSSLYDWLEYIVTNKGRKSIINKSKNTKLFVNGT